MKTYYIPPAGFFIGNFEIRFYGLIMAFSMLVGILLACRLAKKRGVSIDDIFFLALIVLPCAVVGARLYYCIFSDYNYTFSELFNIKQGGLAIYGGVIGGVIGILIFCLIKKNFKLIIDLFDICVPCLILGQAMGRWGNFFNQEAYGNLVTNSKLQWFPYAVFIEAEQAWYQATFFYESLWNLIGLVLLLIVYNKSKEKGTTTGFYLVWYGIGRTLIEGLRSDSLFVGNSGIRVSQLLSSLLVVVGIVIITYNIIKRRKNGQKV
ncbi:MAG: prolipoprotein diacylglyceryl transferase [Clostridiales bacterium]|nr:prolipoprotein diacylglyceryl transferase [Clostridiales bacterium]